MGADTVLRGSVRAPSGFSFGKPSATKPQGLRPLSFAALGLPLENPSGALTLPLNAVSPPSTLSLGDSFSTLPLRFFTVAVATSQIFQKLSVLLVKGNCAMIKIDSPALPPPLFCSFFFSPAFPHPCSSLLREIGGLLGWKGEREKT